MANCELDSHADTSVAGPNFAVIEYTNQVCNVLPFSKHYANWENVPIVKTATAYDDENTGTTYILILGQALYFGDEVKTSLLCPNKMRSNGVIVDVIPTHLSHSNASMHSLIFPEDEVTIPLKLNGCFSYIPTRTPTTNEIEKCKWLILMNDMPWEPNLIPSQDLEDAAITNLERVHYGDRNISSISGGTVNNLQEISDIFDDTKVNQTINFVFHHNQQSTMYVDTPQAIQALVH